jgi:hypothetical protein
LIKPVESRPAKAAIGEMRRSLGAIRKPDARPAAASSGRQQPANVYF